MENLLCNLIFAGAGEEDTYIFCQLFDFLSLLLFHFAETWMELISFVLIKSIGLL